MQYNTLPWHFITHPGDVTDAGDSTIASLMLVTVHLHHRDCDSGLSSLMLVIVFGLEGVPGRVGAPGAVKGRHLGLEAVQAGHGTGLLNNRLLKKERPTDTYHTID